MHRETYYAYSTGFVYDCEPLKVGLHFTGIFGEKNKWFDRRLYETSYTVTNSAIYYRL
jgi:hypothetical protein